MQIYTENLKVSDHGNGQTGAWHISEGVAQAEQAGRVACFLLLVRFLVCCGFVGWFWGFLLIMAFT